MSTGLSFTWASMKIPFGIAVELHDVAEFRGVFSPHARTERKKVCADTEIPLKHVVLHRDHQPAASAFTSGGVPDQNG
jgi:hypothetical protein